MTTITPLELQKSIAVKENFLLIDVREDFEHEHFNIGGIFNANVHCNPKSRSYSHR